MVDKNSAKERQKEMRAAIDEISDVRKVAAYVKQEYVEDGKVNINVQVDELYDPMSMGKFRQLNSSIFDYIDEAASLIPSIVPLRVILHGVEEEDREGVPDMFKLHYQLAAQEKLWDQRVNRTKMVYMTAIGLVFILLFLFFGMRQEDNLFLEILSIIGSFALWEAANCFMVKRVEINRELEKAAQFLTAEIVFDE